MDRSSEHFDVVIVGAGVAGALVAEKLAAAGRRVAVVEAGPEIEDRLGRVGVYASADVKSPGAPYREIVAEADGTEAKYLQVQGSKPFKSGYERVVGGSTWHWLGNVPRLIPSDFEMRRRYGVGVDWPISYYELERWYGEAETELGVAGDSEKWKTLLGATRSTPFPMTEIWPSYSDLQIEAALADDTCFDGVKLRVLRTPQARNSRQYDGRPPCAGNSSCVPICPIGAKYDATVHVRKARDHGAAVMADTVVTRILLEGGVARGVAWSSRTNPDQRGELRGDVVVVAAHAIESVRLLHASEGLNELRELGLNLMDHLNRFGWIRSRLPMYPFRGPPTTSGIDAFRDGEFRRSRGAFRLSLGNDGAGRAKTPEQLVLELVDDERDFFGTRFASELRRRAAGLVRISCSAEMLPSAKNFVRAHATEKDRWGIPRAEIGFEPDQYTRDGYLYAEQVMRTVFAKLDPDAEPEFEKDAGEYSGAGHIMGTTRMGLDASTSVVDRECQVHGHPNLFVVGSSVFPTSGTANPTLTVAALALRLAETLRRRTGPAVASKGIAG